MAEVTRLFDEWAAALARGEQPDPRPIIAKAGAGAAELAALMERFLRARPRAEPDPDRLERVRAWIAHEAPLVQLRTRRGVRRDEVVDAVMAEFELAAHKRPIVKRYYHRLESGQIDPARISRRLLVLLARVLDAPAAAIATWRPRPLEVSPAFRSASDVVFAQEALAAPARARRDVEADDEEVRALFVSGG